MDNAKLTKILSKVEAFPSMPAAGTKLLALLEEPEVSFTQVEDILRYEPGLTANVLTDVVHLANVLCQTTVPARIVPARR